MLQILHKWRWWIWAGSTLAWTALLILPIPQGDFLVFDELRINLRYIVAKTVHVSMYAALTASAGWLAAPMRYRFLLIFCLMVHATLTEIAQVVLHAFGRSGTLQDVAWDHLGIAIGIAVSWRWWVRNDSTGESPHLP